MKYAISGYGCYIPPLRIRDQEFRAVWGKPLEVKSKAVADFDEDALTMGIEAAKEALEHLAPQQVDILCAASTTFPRSYSTVASTFVSSLGLRPDVMSFEFGQSSLSGSEATLAAISALSAWELNTALVVLADCPRADAFDSLDYGLGAASVAFVISRGEGLAELEGFASSMGEHMGERFRPFGHPYLQELGIAAYENAAVSDTIERAMRGLLHKLDTEPRNYTYLTLPHTPAARRVAAQIGFKAAQVELGAFSDRVGDTGLCTPWLAFGAILDKARANERALIVSYGYGSACSALSFRLGDRPETLPPRVTPKIEEGSYIDFGSYLKLRKGIR